jgi:hypothetical protein
MPELSTELAGATSQGGFAEIDGLASGATRTVFSRAEIIAQRAWILHIYYPMSTGHNLGYQHSYSPITLRMLKLLIFYSLTHLTGFE